MMHSCLLRTLGLAAVVAGGVWSAAHLVAAPRQAPQAAAQTPQRPPVPPDRRAFDAALQIKDVGQELDAIVKYAEDFPDSETVYFAVARGMRNVGDADKDDATRLRAFVLKIEDAMTKAAMPYRRADVYYNMAYRLANRKVLADDALRLAGKAVPLLDEQEYIAIQHKLHDDREASLNSRTPSRRPDPFQLAEAVDNFRGVKANYLSALGRAQLLTGHAADAEASLLASYTLAPVMETGMALAGIREKAGKTAEALAFAMAAALTGKMTAPERRILETLYAKTHGGSMAALS